jgi:hypothetical protein
MLALASGRDGRDEETGPVAARVHQEEPRTTLDIDVAVCDRKAIPVVALSAAGFHRTGSFSHSENWVGAGSTPVRFTDDPHLRAGVGRAVSLELEDVVLRILSAEDMLHAKLESEDDALLGLCRLEHMLVRAGRRLFSDPDDVVASPTKRCDDVARHVLVGEQAHRSDRDRVHLLRGQHCARVGEARANVVRRQSRVVAQQLLLGPSLR